MPWITKEGRTVDEARDAAIRESGRNVDDLEVEVVNEGAKGLFGLGGEPAVVRVRPRDEAIDYRSAFDSNTSRPATPTTPQDTATESVAAVEYDDEDDDHEEADDVEDEVAPTEDAAALAQQQQDAAQLGEEIVRGIVERMELAGEIKTRIEGGTVYIEIFGEEMGILIGRSGTTLEALQELVRAGIQRRLKTRQAVVVDVESYWDRRRKPQEEERKPSGGGSGGGGARGRGGRGRGGRGRGRRGGRGRSGGGGGQREGDQKDEAVEAPLQQFPELDA